MYVQLIKNVYVYLWLTVLRVHTISQWFILIKQSHVKTLLYIINLMYSLYAYFCLCAHKDIDVLNYVSGTWYHNICHVTANLKILWMHGG